MYNWYQEGFIVLPQVLLSHYQDLGLSPETFLLVTTILGQKDGDLSPMAVVELCSQHYGWQSHQAMSQLSLLADQGYLVFEMDASGQDRLSLAPLFERLESFNPAAGQKQTASSNETDPTSDQKQTMTASQLIPLIEGEFGRSLSALEYETLNGWLKQDGYAPDLIRLAVKEAVLRQALSLKYIDRILINWERHGLTTATQVQAYLESRDKDQPNNQEAVYDQIDIPLL
ncbi:DnaD domain protein [uncultured Abiotrophia sp.]|uniref:DnaD domain-containing protein n=1 Tax=uncultured Abiotrophia sp. TaxID=316094 RepID=UPI0028EACAC2|nr:DnaD domain protein [uncultured Abiotrophia sp.]